MSRDTLSAATDAALRAAGWTRTVERPGFDDLQSAAIERGLGKPRYWCDTPRSGANWLGTVDSAQLATQIETALAGGRPANELPWRDSPAEAAAAEWLRGR